ncbi:MAG: UvrD-helicase domain-containing protein, partial [Lachnospira sp.]|nr:UvrD-helicase domain-containing protein [Lachnospira sp.]
MAGKWTKEQLQAIETDNCNILVSAAAGSGKTAVLVRRIVRKITDKDNPIDVDRMVVVTFTKAAAAEMRQRIRDALDELIEQEPDNELLQRQLTLLNNAHISTIDSFCLNIVRNHFADIDMDPVFRTADENEIRLLEFDVMEEMIEEYYAKGDKAFFDLVDSYGVGRDDSKLVDIITKIYKYARSFPWEDDWYEDCLLAYDMKDVSELDNNPAVRYLWDDIRSKLTDYRNIYEMLISICEGNAGPKMYTAAIQSDIAGMNMLLEAESFERFVKLVSLLSFDALGRGGKYEVDEAKKEYVKGVRDKYKAYMKSVKEKVLFQSSEMFYEDMKNNMPSVKLLLELARDFSRRMSEEKRNRNIIDFNDMEHMALNILVKKEGENYTYTEVADSLCDYYEEIMIDEYQDSNMLQEVILSAISRGIRGKRGNMYMVGDVKQSIYKFRLACPELFIGKYDIYERKCDNNTDNYLIELRNNFRSRKSVLDASNDVFLRVMNPDFCHIDYNDDVKLNAGLVYPEAPEEVLKDGVAVNTTDYGKDAQVDIHLVTTEDEESDKKELEAAAIADIIEDMFKGDVHMVYDRNVPGGYRPIKYSDIVILGRAIKQGWAEGIVNTLLSRDIPAYADAGDGYFNVREIQIVLSFLKVIDNPLQDIPMSAVMLSYFGGFNAEELAVIRGKRNAGLLYNQLKNVVTEKR